MQKKYIKIVAVFLSLFIILSQSVIAFAVDSKMLITVQSVTANPGERVQVRIDLSNNPGIASLKLKVSYDKFLTLTNVEFDSAFGAFVTAPTPYKNPQTLSMMSPLSNVTANSNFAILTFDVSNNIPVNYHADISLTYDQDDIFNSSYVNVPVEIVNGSVSTQKTPASSFKIQTVAQNGKPGDTVFVNVNLLNNPGIASLKLKVKYDEYLTLENVEFSSAFGNFVTAPEPYKNPQTLSMMSPLANITASGNFATLTFKISDTAPSDYTADILLSYDEDDIFNIDYQNVPVTVENGRIQIGEAETGKFTVQVQSVTATTDKVFVNINLSNNPGLASLKIKVGYDQYLILTDVAFDSAFGAFVTAPTPYKNPQTLSMMSPLSDVSANGTFATLTFKISDNVPDNYTANITLTYDEDDIFDSGYNNIETKIVNGCVYINNGVGIVAKGNTVIDKTSKFIYGLNSGITNINDYVICKNCEINQITDNNVLGTGSKISVIADGKTVDEYTVVIFGDVDGDGVYNGNDAVIVNFLANGMLTKEDVGEAIWVAADCNHDGEINQADVDILIQAGLLLAEVDQTKSAEELSTDSVYLEYQSLIDQIPETPTQKTEQNTIISIIKMIVEFVKSIIAVFKNVMSGFIFVK